MLDGSHHGEGEHDERDVTMPAVPGSGFVVVEPELVFGCLEAILDRPAMALRSEEHTSEIQSLRHLVCRLMLEKKDDNDAEPGRWRLRGTHPLPLRRIQHLQDKRRCTVN